MVNFGMNARRRFYASAILKVFLILVAPATAFLFLIAYFQPLQGLWPWVFFVPAEFAAWIGFIALLCQVFGTTLPAFIGWNDLRLLTLIQNATRRSLIGSNQQLPLIGQIVRSEIADVWDHIINGRSVFLDGPSGSGKSGIASEVVRMASRQDLPVLFLNVRNFNTTVQNARDLDHYVGSGIPLRDCLDRVVSRFGNSLLVIDQLDSAVGTPAFQVITELIAATSIINKAVIVVISTTFDTHEYQPIRELAFKAVHTGLLSIQQTEQLLIKLRVSTPSASLLSLSQNLFSLSVVAEVASDIDLNQSGAQVVLLEKYRAKLEQSEGAEVVNAAATIAYENLDGGMSDFSLGSQRNNAMARLRARDILVPVAHDLIRFRHEQLLYYFYAVGAIDRDIPPQTILDNLAGRHMLSALKWVLRVYYQRHSRHLEEYLRAAWLGTTRLGFIEQTALLDEVVTWPDATEQPVIVDIIAELMQRSEPLRRHFLRAPLDHRWASVLWDKGFYATPPEPMLTDQGSTLVPWDVQYFLEAVAAEAPELALKHVMTISGHSWYVSRAIGILRKAHSAQWEQAVPRIVSWLNDGQIAPGIVHESADLMADLAHDGHLESALKLFQAITGPALTPSSPGLLQSAPYNVQRSYQYVLGTRLEPAPGFEALKRAAPQAVVQILEANLLASLRLEANQAQQPDRELLSDWRHAIEDTDQDILETYNDAILVALRNSLESWNSADSATTEPLLSRYLAAPHKILRRLALHVLGRVPPKHPELVAQELLKRGNLDDLQIHHEFFLLLAAGYPALKDADQAALVAAILDGPDPAKAQQLVKRAQKTFGADPDEYAVQHSKTWIRDRLWMIQGYLIGGAAETLAKLVDKYGTPRHPAHLSWMTGVYAIRQVSPFDDAELARLGSAELLERIKVWRPESTPRFGPEEISYFGLAASMAIIVLADLSKYEEILNDVAAVRPEFAGALIERWRSADELPGAVWNVALSVCESLLGREYVWGDEPSADVDWRYVRLIIAQLLKSGFLNDQKLIPPELQPRARDILLRLVNDPDPTPDADRPPENYAGHNDPMTVALNHVRPVALSALIDYARLHKRQLLAESPLREVPPEQSSLEPIVRTALASKLDRTTESSSAVHSVLGEYLPQLYWLDAGWVVENLGSVFPLGTDAESKWQFVSAWSSYIFNPYYTDLAPLLTIQYRTAIEYLGQGIKTSSHLNPPRRLAGHVAIEYMRGEYDLLSPDGKESLIVAFFSLTPPEIRQEAAWAIADICEDDPANIDLLWPRARAIWQWRVQEAAAAADGSDFDEEMQQIAHLLQSVPNSENLTTLKPLLNSLLPHISGRDFRNWGWDSIEKYLAQEVERDPLRAIQLYRLMYDQRKSPPQWWHHSEEAHKIIEMSGTNVAARPETLSLIDLFASWGDNTFRHVYDQYSS
jgi:hypothetical protein